MAFSLWNLMEATCLILNAICILHEERFLKQMGWGTNAPVQGFGEQPSVKSQILNLVRAIRTVTRIPLIGFNMFLIVAKLIIG